MNITIHRGTHEIGGSCVEIESGGSRIVVDIGMPLVDETGERFDEKKYKNLPGLELVDNKILPDISGFYEWDLESKPIDGLLLSHSHSDHYGFYGYLRKDLPYYLGDGTRRIIDLNGRLFGNKGPIEKYETFQSGAPFRIGPFTITPYLMDHSAFDAYAFLIEAEGKRLLYSGDFRQHGRKAGVFKWFMKNAPQDIDALLLEGTVVGQQKRTTKTEDNVMSEIGKLLKNTPGIALIMMSAHNIDHIVSVYRAALNAGRTFIIDVYTANILNNLNGLGKIPDPLNGFKDLKVFYPRFLSKRLAETDKHEFLYKFKPYKVEKKEISENPGKYIMMVRSTMTGDLRNINGLEGVAVIYSMWHGYLNEDNMKRFQKFMEEKNMIMVPLHTGGHADIDTLQEVVDKIRPKIIIPIHTFKPDLYEQLFPNVMGVSDREMISI